MLPQVHSSFAFVQICLLLCISPGSLVFGFRPSWQGICCVRTVMADPEEKQLVLEVATKRSKVLMIITKSAYVAYSWCKESLDEKGFWSPKLKLHVFFLLNWIMFSRVLLVICCCASVTERHTSGFLSPWPGNCYVRTVMAGLEE